MKKAFLLVCLSGISSFLFAPWNRELQRWEEDPEIWRGERRYTALSRRLFNRPEVRDFWGVYVSVLPCIDPCINFQPHCGQYRMGSEDVRQEHRFSLVLLAKTLVGLCCEGCRHAIELTTVETFCRRLDQPDACPRCLKSLERLIERVCVSRCYCVCFKLCEVLSEAYSSIPDAHVQAFLESLGREAAGVLILGRPGDQEKDESGCVVS